MRCVLKGEDSLRRSAQKALKKAQKPGARHADLLVSRVFRPWLIPVLAVLTVAILQVGGVDRAPLAIFFQERPVRGLLTSLWQVEASAIALVVAASLFAFENLTRQRSDVPLEEYARRSGISYFLMLASSGLLAIPVCLVSSPGLPSPTASFIAAIVSIAGLVALPVFLSRAMKVVHPKWLENQRRKDISSAITAHVRQDALERYAILNLSNWSLNHGVTLGVSWSGDERVVMERTEEPGIVADIDLRALAKLADAVGNGNLILTTRLFEGTGANQPVVVCKVDAPPARNAVITLARDERKSYEFVDQLHEEATEAIRRTSPSAAASIADLYAEAWLAWPEAWASYGENLKGGLLSGPNPLRIDPSDRMKRNVSTAIEAAIERGLRDHLHEFLGILWTVSSKAHRLQADDLMTEMYSLARSVLYMRSTNHPALLDIGRDRAWRFHAESLRQILASLRLRQVRSEEVGVIKRQALQCLNSSIEALRTLLDQRDLDAFKDFDTQLLELIDWYPRGSYASARAIVDEPARFEASPDQVAQARANLALHEAKKGIHDFYRAGRLSPLAWAARNDVDDLDQSSLDEMRRLAESLGTVREICKAVGLALEESDQWLSNWIVFARPPGAGFIDSTGPILKAFALVLLRQPLLADIPTHSWMTSHIAERFDEVAVSAADTWRSHWKRTGESDSDWDIKLDRVRLAVSNAQLAQAEQEESLLIEQTLDAARVQQYTDAVIKGWREAAYFSDFADRFDTCIEFVEEEQWGERRFGFKPQLMPKGLFVSPSDWGGLSSIGHDQGEQLSRGEVSEIVKLVVQASSEIEQTGNGLRRVERLIAALRADNSQPSLLLLPIDWRLARSLGLDCFGSAPTASHLEGHLLGEIDGVPVIEWWNIPEGHAYAVDVTRFCRAVEAVDQHGRRCTPSVKVGLIDINEATEIIESSESAADPSESPRTVRDIQTNVRVDILRMFRPEVLDKRAARYVRLVEETRHDDDLVPEGAE